jgi:hypothetical protein
MARGCRVGLGIPELREFGNSGIPESVGALRNVFFVPNSRFGRGVTFLRAARPGRHLRRTERSYCESGLSNGLPLSIFTGMTRATITRKQASPASPPAGSARA